MVEKLNGFMQKYWNTTNKSHKKRYMERECFAFSKKDLQNTMNEFNKIYNPKQQYIISGDMIMNRMNEVLKEYKYGVPYKWYSLPNVKQRSKKPLIRVNCYI